MLISKEFEFVVERLNNKGSGVAKNEGKSIVCDFVIPGEKILAKTYYQRIGRNTTI